LSQESKWQSANPTSALPSIVLQKGPNRLPTCDHARNLLFAYRESIGSILVANEEEKMLGAINRTTTGDIAEIRHKFPALYSLLMLICASGLILLPPSYCITLGIVSKYDEVGPLIDAWQAEAFDTLELENLILQPTIICIQALITYQINFGPR
jgi:hypothetical protein